MRYLKRLAGLMTPSPITRAVRVLDVVVDVSAIREVLIYMPMITIWLGALAGDEDDE